MDLTWLTKYKGRLSIDVGVMEEMTPTKGAVLSPNISISGMLYVKGIMRELIIDTLKKYSKYYEHFYHTTSKSTVTFRLTMYDTEVPFVGVPFKVVQAPDNTAIEKYKMEFGYDSRKVNPIWARIYVYKKELDYDELPQDREEVKEVFKKLIGREVEVV